MSKLEQLINELCADGVEYKSLGNCLVRTKGTKITAEQMQQLNKENAPVKIFAGGKTVAYFDYADLPEKDIQTTPSIIVKSRGLVEFEYYDKPFSHKNEFWAYHSNDENINIKYIYYCLKKEEHYFKNVATSMGSLPQISIPVTENFKIPIPPLPLQEEIVRILDNFTELIRELTIELTTELTARKQQYEYYRDSLLTFSDEVEWKPLGKICINCDCQRKPVTKSSRQAGKYPYYGASGIVDYVSDYIFEGDYLLVSEDGANLVARSTPIAFSISGKNWVNNHAHVLQFDTYEMRRFVEIYLNALDLSRYISAAAQPKLTKDNLNKIPVPVPEFKQVKHIVEILDRFDKLCKDISEDLPAEIMARQQQYEYYRDKILTFKEKEV
ncbi:MAG: restriction endonuclease subunit S [Oscillospiraceae bacterium]